jgi:beta-lactamase superfamily II metal-dependent hydrolase
VSFGQGDSTLIISPDGTNILIDAGDTGYFSKDGGKIVFEHLESIGVDHLDYNR